MQVKIEPNDQLDLPVVGLDVLTEIESDLFREQLFGNPTVISNSDVSESSSDDDHLSKMSLKYEPFSDYSLDSSSFPSTFWDPSSSRSSSASSSFDHTLAEYEFHQTSFRDFQDDDLDVEVGTCSPQDVIMNANDVKEEASTTETLNESSNSLWDLLCSADVKPNVKILETPPVTPPENDSVLGDSPPTSPFEVQTTTDPGGPPSCLLPPPTSVITVSPVSSKPDPSTPPKKKLALAPKIPFKIVTTITASENGSNNNLNKALNSATIKIKPKSSVSSTNTILTIGGTTVPKLTFPKTGAPSVSKSSVISDMLKNNNKLIAQKPVVVSSPQTTSHSTHIQNSTTIPTSVKVTKCNISSEKSAGPRLPPIAPALNPNLKNNSLAELRALKRQQRMIKNRESASLSRKRKKEYLQGLEERVRELDMENAKLRTENERLVRRVTSLENERVIMRAARFPIKRSSTAVMGLMFLFLFNLSPVINIFSGGSADKLQEDVLNGANMLKSQKISGNSVNTFQHRSLLSFSPFEAFAGTGDNSATPPANHSHICPVNFNSTESLRIDNELRDLFDSSSKDWSPKSEKSPPAKPRTRFHPKSNSGRQNYLSARKEEDEGERKALGAPLTSVLSSAGYQYLYESEEETPSLLPSQEEQKNVFSKGMMSASGSLQSLFDSIERRNDTYYVVSLTADHLLLPASAHNTSVRPKMSLLVPTPKTWSDSDQVGFMQIDCEVTHTRVVRWTKRQEEVSMSSVAPAESYRETSHINGTETSDSYPKEKPKRRRRKRV